MTEDDYSFDEWMAREAERALEAGDYASVLLVYYQSSSPGPLPFLNDTEADETVRHAAEQAAEELRRQKPAFPPELGLFTPFNIAMKAAKEGDGPTDLTEAVVGLANVLGDMPYMRTAAAAFVIAHYMEPFGTATRKLHRETFGHSLGEYLASIMPDRERLEE